MIPFRHVLALIDLSPRSRHTALHAATLARACKASFTLLHVLPANGGEAPVDGEKDMKALVALAEIARDVSPGWLPHVVARQGDWRSVARTYAFNHGVDLMVIGSRRPPVVKWGLFASSDEGVVSAEPWSVLALPAPDDEARRAPTSESEILCAVGQDDASHEALEIAASVARVQGSHLTVLHVTARERTDGQVLRVAARLRASLIVMPTAFERVGHASAFELAPAASALLRHAPCPMLLIPTVEAPASTSPVATEDVLVAPV